MSEFEPLVKYGQLTEDEQAFMWRVWDAIDGGLHEADVRHSDTRTIINLQNFGLIYQSFRKYRYTNTGKVLMVAEKLRERQSEFVVDGGAS